MIKFFVISHTHWDREWYQPFEIMKLRLVELIDYLLEILEKDSTYIFHLDEQTVILEDYLSIRPEKEEVLKKYIKSKNILIGPWYMQNDFYYSSGESTIRNLKYGIDIAEKFGYVNKAGYAPDNFGIISQLPQILNNFGIDTLLFGRGYDRWYLDKNSELCHEKRPAEFVWEGADDSILYANYMKGWYNNAQRIPDNIDDALHMLSVAEEVFEGFNVSPFILLMNGVDHLEAQDNIKEILAKINDYYGDEVIKQVDLESYLNSVKEILKNTDKPYVHKGELKEGRDEQLLKDCASSRVYLKVKNVLAQNFLEYKLEPLYAMLESFGAKGVYSKGHFDYFWKNQLKQLLHDNICGCSHDSVNRHMEDLFARMDEGTYEYFNKGLDITVNHIKMDAELPEHYKIAVVNTTNVKRNGLVKVSVDLPLSEKINEFTLQDGNGNALEYSILKKTVIQKDIVSGLNLPGIIDCVRYELLFHAGEINAFAVKAFLLKKGKTGVVKAITSNKITNGIITIERNGNGLDISYKDRKVVDFIGFEDSYDCGDAYRYCNTAKSPYKLQYELTSCKFTQSSLQGKAEVEYVLYIPKDLNLFTRERSSRLVKHVIKLEVLLDKESDLVKINYSFVNKSKNHRFRIIFKTDVISEGFFTDSPFDIIYHDGTKDYPCALSKVQTNTSFSCVENGKNGVAVFTKGQHEVENVKSGLAFTLVRANGFINVGEEYSPEGIGGDMWNVPENQCLRELNGSFGFLMYDKNYVEAELPNRSIEFRNELVGCFNSCDAKKFSGGRFAVQDSKLQYLYYRDDKYKDLVIPENKSVFNINGKGISVTSVKVADNGEGLIVRAYNYTDKEVLANVEFLGKIYMSNMEENMKTKLGENKVDFTFGPKKIITFLFVLGNT